MKQTKFKIHTHKKWICYSYFIVFKNKLWSR